MLPFGDSNRQFPSLLQREVAEWERDGTITPEQAQAILARYPEDTTDYEAARRRQALVVGLSVLGAVLVGLGVITFFAANWNDISRGVKLGSLIAGVLLSYGSGYLLWQRLGYTAVGLALVLLGCIIFGAGYPLDRADIQLTRRSPQPHRFLVSRRPSPCLCHSFPSGHGADHSPLPGRRRVPT